LLFLISALLSRGLVCFIDYNYITCLKSSWCLLNYEIHGMFLLHHFLFFILKIWLAKYDWMRISLNASWSEY
jgi:hypothetical protein